MSKEKKVNFIRCFFEGRRSDPDLGNTQPDPKPWFVLCSLGAGIDLGVGPGMSLSFVLCPSLLLFPYLSIGSL